ncbi:hypothetical protein BDA99DRAFT_593285 [Phascolomyces articulosus]|uniref:Uncharacterized protein n=1 Tax=Phascolomyces articulosus TaxID=60185 RepID=A0AAD5PH99_9FUNG|nr:hypothetical protein BDA99DRAFT_593285 [Phascolomyces articulosus]
MTMLPSSGRDSGGGEGGGSGITQTLTNALIIFTGQIVCRCGWIKVQKWIMVRIARPSSLLVLLLPLPVVLLKKVVVYLPFLCLFDYCLCGSCTSFDCSFRFPCHICYISYFSISSLHNHYPAVTGLDLEPVNPLQMPVPSRRRDFCNFAVSIDTYGGGDFGHDCNKYKNPTYAVSCCVVYRIFSWLIPTL